MGIELWITVECGQSIVTEIDGKKVHITATPPVAASTSLPAPRPPIEFLPPMRRPVEFENPSIVGVGETRVPGLDLSKLLKVSGGAARTETHDAIVLPGVATLRLPARGISAEELERLEISGPDRA